jgi:predicted DNA-binding transcriptional regulator AlpA
VRKPENQHLKYETRLPNDRGKLLSSSAPTLLPHQRDADRASGDDEPSDLAPSLRRYLTGPQVCQRYGVTDMSVWRWLQNPELGFPKPAMIINRRRFWLEDELVAWERARAAITRLAGADTVESEVA